MFAFIAVLSRDMLKLALSDLYEEKEENDIEELMKAAEQELSSGEVTDSFTFSNLFIEVFSIYRIVIYL